MEVEAGMAKPIPTSKPGIGTSSKEVATIKTPAIRTPNKQAIPTLRSPLRHNKLMEGDSNREATRVDTVKLRRRLATAQLIQLVQVRRAAAMVRSILSTIMVRELTVPSWRQRR